MSFPTTIFATPEFSILRDELRKRRRVLLFGILTAIFASSISAVIPYLYGRLTDLALLTARPVEDMLAILLIWLLLDILQALLNRRVWQTATNLGFEIWGGLTLAATQHLINLPLSFHRERKMGEVLNKVTRGIERGWDVFEDVVFLLVPQLIGLMGATIFTFFLEWRMALVLLAVMIIYVIVSLRLIRPIMKDEPKEHYAWERAYGQLWDSVLNVETVKSHTAEYFERRRLSREFGKAGTFHRKIMNFWHTLGFWQSFVFTIGFIAVFGSGILLLRQNELSPGKLIMFLGYMNLALGPLSRLANEYRHVRRAVTSLKRSLAIFKIEPEKDLPRAKPIGTIRGDIAFEAVAFQYGKKQAIIKDISFRVEAGQKVAFVGESGVGKTTLTNLLLRYWLPKEGKIYIDGKEIREITHASLRKQMAVVPQEVLLFNDTIKNNIRYGRPDATDKEVVAAAKAANAHEFIENFPKKYKQLVGERGIKLSAGQKQRVAIARALLRNPRILILDEATAALDSASEKLVQEALERLIKGKTTFIIAHRLSTIAKANTIIVFEKGRVAEIGTHQDLLKKKGLYWNFWTLQTSLGKEVFDEKAKIS